MTLRRREFIKLLTGTTTFSLASRYGLFPHLSGSEALAAQVEDTDLRPPEETWVPSVCGQCPAGCGILVRVYGDRAVKIDGNPLHPISRGALCARGQSGLQVLYDPDRLTGPLARDGKRGEGKWKPISWKEALSTSGEKLKEIRKQGKPQTLALWTGPQRGLSRTVSERFMEAYGSPNLVRFEPDRAAGSIPAVHLMQGVSGGITYDIENADYILSFNSGLLDDHWSPVELSRAYGRFRRGRKEVRGKLVQIEPRLSVTGAKADEWVPILPGSEGVLAMGIASVLIVERRYDGDFIAERTFGFDDWTDRKGTLHPGFKTLVIQEYPLDKVVKLTGVPRDTIIALAREFAQLQPAIAIGNDGQGVGHQGVYNRMAVHALNALVGNIQKNGGVLTKARLPEMHLPPYSPDTIAAKGGSMPRMDGAGTGPYALTADVPGNLTEQILKKRPYPLEALLIHGANPVFQSPDPDRTLAALHQVPTIISFSSFMDETSRYADLILPDSVYLEKWQVDTSYTLHGNPVVTLGRPAVEPVHDTRDTCEVLAALAKNMGGSPAGAFPAAESEALAKTSLLDLNVSGRGEVFGAALEEVWTILLEQSGWKVRSRQPFETFWSNLKERGGWWDPVYYPWEWKRVFSTPSGRFEFYSLTVKNYLKSLNERDLDLALQKIAAPVDINSADTLCLPRAVAETVRGAPGLYPLEVHPYTIPILSGLRQTSQPWLQDITGFHVYESWHTWVEIHPETARPLGIEDGEWSWVETEEGKIRAKIRFFQGVMPQMINLPVGLGHQAGGRWTAGIGEDVLKILRTEKEPLTGRIRFLRSRARLTRVKG